MRENLGFKMTEKSKLKIVKREVDYIQNERIGNQGRNKVKAHIFFVAESLEF